MESFSTHGIPVHRKVSFWNQISSETFAAMEVAPRNLQAFDGQLRRAALGTLTLMEVHSAAVRIRRTRAHIARAREASWLLLAPMHRALQLTVDRAPGVTVGPGELCLLDHARPYEIVHGDATRTLCVDIPRRLLDAELPGAGRLAGRALRTDSGGIRLLLALLQAIDAEFQAGAGLPSRPETAHALWSLILAACTPAGGAAGPGRDGARVGHIHALIDAQLSDPALCPADIAAGCGFSERRLRALLHAAGESFSAYLLRRRLELCARMLRDPRWSAHALLDIALQAGLSDASHFGRAFKARFGRTPRDYRRSTGGG